jgi:prepilin-type N-terminal cleavage/methylation domain-containing protein
MRTTLRQAFTLLEVMIALAILAMGLSVLVETQATAALVTAEGTQMATATMLAHEKMTEAILVLEREGWGTQDMDEEGDFADFGDEDFRGESLHLDLDEELEDFQWAYTVRTIDLSMSLDMGSIMGELAGSGYFGEEATTEMDTSQAPNLGDMGISTDMITEYLSSYLREVRVLVWWGSNEEGEDQIEIVHHVVNPTGLVNETEENL